MRLEALKKAEVAANEKKKDIEEKVHDSIFNAPFTNPPKEVPFSWEHNTSIIPGLSSIKGSAVRQWSVNQVAKFVSSLKGCIDQGKLFREQVSEFLCNSTCYHFILQCMKIFRFISREEILTITVNLH